MKILGYILIVGGLGVMAFNGSPRRWEKGTVLKHILIDLGGLAVALAGFWLAGKWI
ncbi:MAG TPA: hypothetical protein PK629_11180 [Oscillospiraceae bacterium]|nr:hypothetical protein [Oscillospiraceae bacterium]HPK34667.1 hypothetical protein [Oscillospiraceae bacterium]HPR74569.1 hypothetical protein [Oscillospiraceae bacterium]